MADQPNFTDAILQLFGLCGEPSAEGHTWTWTFNSAPPPSTFTFGRGTYPLAATLVRITWDTGSEMTPTFRGKVPHRKGRPVWRAHTRKHWGQHG